MRFSGQSIRLLWQGCIGIRPALTPIAYLYLKQHEMAVEWARKAVQKNTQWSASTFLISALTHLGRTDEAQHAYEEMTREQPSLSIEFVRQHLPTNHQPYMDHLLDGLRKAGLPE